MKVLIVEPGKETYIAEINKKLNEMQKIVGGHIEAVYPFHEQVAIICNGDGKNDGLPLNRALFDDDGEIYDIIAGTFFVCGLSKDDFDSLPDEYIERFEKRFHHPEIFAKVNGRILAKKISTHK